MASAQSCESADVAVIGAGFGGLAAALRMQELGARVALFETLAYPGGCASTFTRSGYQFEAGATLFSGFGEGELFARWIAECQLPVVFEPLAVPVELRAPGLVLPVASDRAQFLAQMRAAAPAYAKRIDAFFAEQRAVADALWALFREPALLPPFGLAQLTQHALRTPAYLPILRHIGRPLLAAVERHGLLDCAPLRMFLDCVCQITVQTSASRAEAPFAMGAMDYYFRGTGHVQGGIGVLASALVKHLAANGARVSLADRVQRIETNAGGYAIHSRRGVTQVRGVVGNLLPGAARKLLGDALGQSEARTLGKLEERVRGGWGAVMLYRVLAQPGAGSALHESPHHLELVLDAAAPLVAGNHVFCSVSGASEIARVKHAGERTVTISTHIPLAEMLAKSAAAQASYIADVQKAMRRTVAARAPELDQGVVLEMTASPRTFERFTGRPQGYVGGIPRIAGLANYAALLPTRAKPNFYLCGDTFFPGQSTLAVALGGIKVAERLARDLQIG